jgi:hypothetical protein
MIVATLIELFVLHRPPVAALACLSGHTFVAWARMSHARRSWLRPVTVDADARSALLRTLEARWAFPRQPRTHAKLRSWSQPTLGARRR